MSDSFFTLQSPEDIPDWVREGNWIWRPYTSVFGSGAPDGYLVSNITKEKFGLDLIAVDCGFYTEDDNNATQGSTLLAAQLLAWESWEEETITVLHEDMYGAATLLVPIASFTYDTFFEAIYRFCAWTGMSEDAVFSCSAEVNLPHQGFTRVEFPS